MKEHIRIHLYKNSTFKCEDCEYCSENFLTMEVHVGKDHIENIKCGLCDVRCATNEAADLEKLNLHLSTCQIYVCDEYCFRSVHIHDIKEQFEKIALKII